MRLCRYESDNTVAVGLYDDQRIVPIAPLAAEFRLQLPTPPSSSLLDYLGGVHNPHAEVADYIHRRYSTLTEVDRDRFSLPAASVRLLVPIPHPSKIILLAGNYAEHIREGGGQAAERQETFPYYFMKPPSTTLTHPGDPIRIPASSPDNIDWEIELGVIIGRRCRDVPEADALAQVAGYTICNDISDRQYQINPARHPRDKDGFFDWLHGKWHDTFLPVGPCLLVATPEVDPQAFPLRLSVNGEVMQNGTTAQMIFPVAALVSILSSFVTLEPGDIISTGTPSGIGHARKPPVHLKAGDTVEAEIAGIGVLRNPVEGPRS